MRKMASVCTVDDLRPIKGADAIECAVIGGWTVVVKKGDFNVGELAVYLEIDSWVPTLLAPFLSKGKEPKEYNGVKGERLRTVTLRGQLSQGLLLKLGTVDNAALCYGDIQFPCINGLDVTDYFGIQKWERPMNAQLAGLARGNFPSQIPKTDQERVQNLMKEVAIAKDAGLRFEVTEKLEGSSMTVYLIRGEFGVCSRNLDLKETAENTFWEVARRDGIEEKMRAHDEYWDFAIQGELIGPGIQGNIYKLTQPEFRVFDVYNIQTGSYLNPAPRRDLIKRMGLLHVPVIWNTWELSEVDSILAQAEGRAWLNGNQEREGVVYKQVDGGMTFKAISNKFLLKGGE